MLVVFGVGGLRFLILVLQHAADNHDAHHTNPKSSRPPVIGVAESGRCDGSEIERRSAFETKTSLRLVNGSAPEALIWLHYSEGLLSMGETEGTDADAITSLSRTKAPKRSARVYSFSVDGTRSSDRMRLPNLYFYGGTYEHLESAVPA